VKNPYMGDFSHRNLCKRPNFRATARMEIIMELIYDATLQKPDFYFKNHDFIGSRTVQNAKEQVQFHNNSSMRIWYNDLPADFEEHWHSALELIVPIDNYYDVIINQTTYRVHPGEIAVIPPGELHSIIAPATGVRFIYLFDLSFASNLCDYSKLQTVLSQTHCITRESHPDIYESCYMLLTRIRNEYFSNQETTEFIIYSLLFNFFTKLIQNHIESTAKEIHFESLKQKEYIKKFHDVLAYIDAHYMEDLCLEDISASIGFSKYHFSRLFKQYTNFTFCDYLNYRRIKAAENLLCKNDLTVTEVALQSGFSSISTFNRLFKQLKGCSPREFRSKNTIINFS